MTRPTHIFFDVNETLTDFSPVLDAAQAALGGGPGQGRRWFNVMIEYSLAETLSGMHDPFLDIGAAALSMVAAEDGLEIAQEKAHDLLSDAIGKVEAWPDCKTGLALLRDKGFAMATLTNSGEDAQRKTLERVGLSAFFDDMIGVQSTGAYKPDRRTFAHGLSRMNADADHCLMVACHPWDLIGARAIGMRVAYVERPGTAWYPLADKPDYHVRGIDELADLIETREA